MQSQRGRSRLYSFEFFPPKTPEGMTKLQATVKQLAQLKPHFFSVTYGAGGSTREGTLATVLQIREAGHAAAPHASEKRASCEKLLIGMMPGTIGTSIPSASASSTKWKYESAL